MTDYRVIFVIEPENKEHTKRLGELLGPDASRNNYYGIFEMREPDEKQLIRRLRKVSKAMPDVPIYCDQHDENDEIYRLFFYGGDYYRQYGEIVMPEFDAKRLKAEVALWS